MYTFCVNCDFYTIKTTFANQLMKKYNKAIDFFQI